MGKEQLHVPRRSLKKRGRSVKGEPLQTRSLSLQVREERQVSARTAELQHITTRTHVQQLLPLSWQVRVYLARGEVSVPGRHREAARYWWKRMQNVVWGALRAVPTDTGREQVDLE